MQYSPGYKTLQRVPALSLVSIADNCPKKGTFRERREKLTGFKWKQIYISKTCHITKEILGKLQAKLQKHAYKSKLYLLALLLRVSVLYLTGTDPDVSAETRKNQATKQQGCNYPGS